MILDLRHDPVEGSLQFLDAIDTVRRLEQVVGVRGREVAFRDVLAHAGAVDPSLIASEVSCRNPERAGGSGGGNPCIEHLLGGEDLLVVVQALPDLVVANRPNEVVLISRWALHLDRRDLHVLVKPIGLELPFDHDPDRLESAVAAKHDLGAGFEVDIIFHRHLLALKLKRIDHHFHGVAIIVEVFQRVRLAVAENMTFRLVIEVAQSNGHVFIGHVRLAGKDFSNGISGLLATHSSVLKSGRKRNLGSLTIW